MVKVLFFGTPAIAVPYLEWLTQYTQVKGVVCRKDEPVGRGLKLTAPPTKVFAESNNIPVFQPAGPWTDEIVSSLKGTGADVGIVVAYGRLMPRPVFEAPKLGCINIHFSILPKYRGAAPMQWALINGEKRTGVSAFWIEEGLDSGPVFDQTEVAIASDDRVPELRAKLVPAGIEVLSRVILDIEKGKILREPQKGEQTLAPLMKKELGIIDWKQPAEKIVNLIRGVCEWPGASAAIGAPPKRLKILRARVAEGSSAKEPGAIVDVVKEQGIVIQSGMGRVLVLEVQPEGKKPMSAWSFWLGAHMKIGDKLG